MKRKLLYFIFVLITIMTISANKSYNDFKLEGNQVIKEFYKSLNNGDYEIAYKHLYKYNFANYELLREYWKQTYIETRVISVEKQERYKDKLYEYYKVKVYINYKEDPSKYLTERPIDGIRQFYITMIKDINKTWKIYKYSKFLN